MSISLASILWLQLGCTLFLIALLMACLIKAVRGTRFKFVITLIVLLLLSNIGTLINIEASFALFVIEDSSSLQIYLLCIGQGVQDVFFCVAHWMFAS
jgi:hypothetical protein